MKFVQDLKALPRPIWVLAFSTLVNRMGTMVLPFLVIYLTLGMGYSATLAGAVMAVYGAVAILAGPMGGKLSDRFGTVRVMNVSLIASAAVMFLFPFAHSLPAVIALTALLSFTNEAFRPANMTLISELAAPSQMKQAYAFFRLAINLGMSLGPAIGGFLAQWSYSWLFIIDGVTTLAGAAILLAYFGMPAKAKAAPSGDAQPVRKSLLIWDPTLWIFLAVVVPVAIVFFQHNSTLPLFLTRDLGFKESTYGLLFVINTALIILLEMPLNSATAHWSHAKTLSLGALAFALGFGALAFAHEVWSVALTIVIWTFGEMILFPGLSAYISETAPEGRRGEYMGMFSMSFSVAFMIGPWAGTWALESLGAGALWGASFLVGIASTLGFAWVARRPRVPAQVGLVSG